MCSRQRHPSQDTSPLRCIFDFLLSTPAVEFEFKFTRLRRYSTLTLKHIDWRFLHMFAKGQNDGRKPSEMRISGSDPSIVLLPSVILRAAGLQCESLQPCFVDSRLGIVLFIRLCCSISPALVETRKSPRNAQWLPKKKSSKLQSQLECRLTSRSTLPL